MKVKNKTQSAGTSGQQAASSRHRDQTSEVRDQTSEVRRQKAEILLWERLSSRDLDWDFTDVNDLTNFLIN